ncbi:LysR family transcriptional regulator [Robertmurraya massiliosenegalensis]|uniref:LysR family transcriptional regulator n=1 Tax=Robertmurraya TaxID=2837507 RepID=UPI0039A4117E
MQLEELKTFVTLAEVKNFTKTADKLLMSQPTVSLHIKNLEKEFNTDLFQRSPKFLKITPSGQLLLLRAKKIIEVYDIAKQEILEFHHKIAGKLTIGASYSIGEYILPSILCELQKKYPTLEIEMMIGNREEILQYVRQFQIDIGFIEGEAMEKDLRIVAFMEEEFFIVSSPAHLLTGKQEITFHDLKKETWLSREVGSGNRDFLLEILSTNGLKINSLLTMNSIQAIKESVINGLGVSLLSKHAIKRELEHRYLAILPIYNQSFTRTFSYVYSPIMENNKNVEAFIEVLEEKWR